MRIYKAKINLKRNSLEMNLKKKYSLEMNLKRKYSLEMNLKRN